MKKVIIFIVSLILAFLVGCSSADPIEAVATAEPVGTTNPLPKLREIVIDDTNKISVLEYEDGTRSISLDFDGADPTFEYVLTLCLQSFDDSLKAIIGDSDGEEIGIVKVNGKWIIEVEKVPISWRGAMNKVEESTIPVLIDYRDKINFVTSEIGIGNCIPEELEPPKQTEIPTQTVTLEEKYSDEYVTVWYSHCEENTGSARLVFVIENKTEKNIGIIVESLSVDGWNLSDVIAHEYFAPKSKGRFEVSSTEIQTKTPSEITGKFRMTDETREIWGSYTRGITF